MCSTTTDASGGAVCSGYDGGGGSSISNSRNLCHMKPQLTCRPPFFTFRYVYYYRHPSAEQNVSFQPLPCV